MAWCLPCTAIRILCSLDLTSSFVVSRSDKIDSFPQLVERRDMTPISPAKSFRFYKAKGLLKVMMIQIQLNHNGDLDWVRVLLGKEFSSIEERVSLLKPREMADGTALNLLLQGDHALINHEVEIDKMMHQHPDSRWHKAHDVRGLLPTGLVTSKRLDNTPLQSRIFKG